MINTYTFKGKAAWIKTDPSFTNDDGSKVWSMTFYPEDASVRKAIKDTGVKNRVAEDDGEKSGVEGLCYTFRSKAPYQITDEKGNVITDRISNGASVAIELEVETFTSKTHGPQARSKLVRVLVSEYTPYNPPADEPKEDKAELPA